LQLNTGFYPGNRHGYDSEDLNGGPPQSMDILQMAVQRTYASLFAYSYVPWKFYPRGYDFEPATDGQASVTAISLKQNASDPENVLKGLAGEVNESYSLSLTEDGEAIITAATTIGLIYGLVTFSQLFYKHSKGGVYTKLAPVEITDFPMFPHRGLNMDVSRNWFEVADIKRMIDACAYNKMNRLHLHVTDSQSWPLEIPALPELASKGAYRSDLTFSPEEIKQIQFYGAVQGVQVYVETDMPGHTASIWYSHPELIAAFEILPNWNTYANEPPSGTLKLNSSAVYDFLSTLWDDLLPRLTDYSAYYHTGGDEVSPQIFLLS